MSIQPIGAGQTSPVANQPLDATDPDAKTGAKGTSGTKGAGGGSDDSSSSSTQVTSTATTTNADGCAGIGAVSPPLG